MRNVLILVIALASTPLHAQQAKVVTNCGSVFPLYDTAGSQPFTVTPDGRQCMTSVGGGSSNLATNQVSVGTGATLIAPARAGRNKVKVTMIGAVDAFIGASGVTVSTGDLLLGTKGSSVTIETSAAVYGIAGSAVTVSYMETF